MIPCRPSCWAVAAAGVLLVALPTVAHARPAPDRLLAAEERAAEERAADERVATALLERAVTAGRRLQYRGTQHVTVWRDGVAHRTSAELAHDPRTGSVLHGNRGERPQAVGDTAVLDPRVLDRLASAYALEVRGPVRWAGRTASVVQARRGDGAVAGRLWVDRDSGLLLRREVYDASGRRARSTALVDLTVAAADVGDRRWTSTRQARTTTRPARLQRLRSSGWPVVERLPGGFRLLEARLQHRVLQLAYTDGLSTLSVFVQHGGLDAPLEGFAAQRVAGWPVLVQRAAPERVVWTDGRHVYTVVSDAPEPAVLAVVAALPHQSGDGGLLARLERGTARLAGMLNPLD